MSENYELLRASRNGIELFQNKSPIEKENECHRQIYPDGRGHFHAEILKLIGRVFLMQGPFSPHVVVFSAVENGSGCSLVCAQVAEALAVHVEGKVCLIDANPLSPSLRRYFHLGAKSPEQAMAPQGPASSIQSIQGSNLWLFSGASTSSAGSGPTSPERMKERLSELSGRFSYVLLDVPPINESADALMLGRIADGVILVLEADSTRRAAALKAKQTLDGLKIKILGAVLNHRTYPVPDWIYRKL